MILKITDSTCALSQKTQNLRRLGKASSHFRRRQVSAQQGQARIAGKPPARWTFACDERKL